jgi:hypothetical protein
MRILLLAVSTLALAAACDNAKPAATASASPTASAPSSASPTDAMAGHDMSAMASSAAADMTNTAETKDGYTFHVMDKAVPSAVHLPAGEWKATASNTLVEVGAAADAKMPDGVTHHVVPVMSKTAGNADVTFERSEAGKIVETRTIHFMIH